MITLRSLALLPLVAPAGIPAGPCAAHPIVNAIAWFATVAVIGFISIAALAAIAACMLSSQTSADEEAEATRRFLGARATQQAAEPLAPVGPASAPRQLFVITAGEMPVPLNPLGPSVADVRLRS